MFFFSTFKIYFIIFVIIIITTNFGRYTEYMWMLIYLAVRFADKAAALNTINGWVSRATGGRVKTALDDIASDAQLYLGRPYTTNNKK